MNVTPPRLIIIDGYNNALKEQFVEALSKAIEVKYKKKPLYKNYPKETLFEGEVSDTDVDKMFGSYALMTMIKATSFVKGDAKVYSNSNLSKHIKCHHKEFLLFCRETPEDYTYKGLFEYRKDDKYISSGELYRGLVSDELLQKTQVLNSVYRTVYLHVGDTMIRKHEEGEEPLIGLDLIAENLINCLDVEHYRVRGSRSFMVTQVLKEMNGEIHGFLG